MTASEIFHRIELRAHHNALPVLFAVIIAATLLALVHVFLVIAVALLLSPSSSSSSSSSSLLCSLALLLIVLVIWHETHPPRTRPGLPPPDPAGSDRSVPRSRNRYAYHVLQIQLIATFPAGQKSPSFRSARHHRE